MDKVKLMGSDSISMICKQSADKTVIYIDSTFVAIEEDFNCKAEKCVFYLKANFML